MNKALALDQSEKIGLGAAVGGHLFLLALLVFGLFQAARPSGADGGGGGDGEGIAVSIVSEMASAAPASGPVEPEPVPEVQEVVTEVEPVANPEPVPVKKPVEKVAQKPSPVKKTIQPRKDAGKSSGRGSSDFDRRMKEVLQQQSSSGGSTSSSSSSSGGSTGGGGGGSSTAQEVKTARATISRQIRIGNCIPTGIDVNKVITKVTVRLASNGKLLSITDVSQSGQTASNRAQLEPIKRCIVDSVKKVDRFTGLDPATHSSWELISVPFASKG